MLRPFALVLVVMLCGLSAGVSHAQRYNPYADAHEVLPPVAPDGTLQWGTFFKSAQLQRSYERLWNLGACRGTNKAITEPVEDNKLLIDRLPEAEFAGVVQTAHGSLAGGVVAFTPKGAGGHDAPLFAQLHPAGVSHLNVTGPAAVGDLRPGTVVRIKAAVDERGRGSTPLQALTIVTPTADFTPEAVRPDHTDMIVAGVVSLRGQTLVVRVDAGKLRRLTFTLAADAAVTVDGARLDLVAAGDAVEIKGRLWSGAGSTGAGTIFASHVTVAKQPPARPESRAVAAGAGAGGVRAVE
jgi:hypothetical protein